MLSELQNKSIEFQVLGFTKKKISEMLGLTANTITRWSIYNEEYKRELSRATTAFTKCVRQARIRKYRQIQKALQDEILKCIDNGGLEDISIEDLFKMLSSSVL